MQHLENILLTSSFVVPLILAFSILIDGWGNVSKRVVGFALFNAFYVFFANYFYFRHLMLDYINLHSLHIATVLWLFPSIYIYVRSIVGNEKEFRKALLHLIPGFIFGIVSAILFYGFLNQEERIYYLMNYRSSIELSTLRLKLVYGFRMIDVAMIMLQVVYYSIVMIRIPSRYNERLMQEYSNIESFSVNWIKWFNVAFVLVGLLSILFYVVNPLDDRNDLFLVFFLFSVSVFMWVLGIWSFKQQKPSGVEYSFAPTMQQTVGNTVAQEELTQSLLDFFDNEQPYLEPDLNLTRVCKRIGTNRTYLSSLINNKFGMNFNAFVNQYRVKHISQYLKVHPGTSKEVLVNVGGFGSVSSLKRAMAKFKED